MTDPDRRVAILAAVFLPERAEAALARLGTAGAPEALALAVRLARSPRRDRLRALSEALAPGPAVRASAGAIAALERRRIASLVRTFAAAHAAPESVSPLVARLCRERMS